MGPDISTSIPLTAVADYRRPVGGGVSPAQEGDNFPSAEPLPLFYAGGDSGLSPQQSSRRRTGGPRAARRPTPESAPTLQQFAGPGPRTRSDGRFRTVGPGVGTTVGVSPALQRSSPEALCDC